MAKLVRWLHSQTVVSLSDRLELTVQPLVSHRPVPLCTSCSLRNAQVGPTCVAFLCCRVMTIDSARADVFSSFTPVLFSVLLTATAVITTLFTSNSGQGSAGYHSLREMEASNNVVVCHYKLY